MSAIKKLQLIIELFATESSIHGVKYIGNRKYSKLVRIFWLFLFFLSLAGLTYAAEVYRKWFVDPNITVNKKFLNIRQIASPAFTICPIRKLRKEFQNVENIKSQKKTLSTEQRQYLEALLLLQVESYNYLNFEEYLINATLESNRIVDMILTTSYDIDESLFGCFKLDGIPFNCTQKYQKVLTSEGYCFTFNSLDHESIFNANVLHEDFDGYKNGMISDWTPANGNTTADIDAYPLRILSTLPCFDVAMIIDLNDNNLEDSISIVFHLPNEIVGSLSKVNHLDYLSDSRLILSVSEHRTDESLGRSRPEKRQCFFENERNLQFFKQYTRDNCFYECLINYTLTTCGCVKYSMPRQRDTQICNATKLECYLKAVNKWLDNDPKSATSEFPCNCLPPCNGIHYERYEQIRANDCKSTQSTYTELSFTKTNNTLLTRITANFDNFLIEQHHRYVTYTIQNVVADVGGLLGLFIGCSLLTIVEFIYLIIAGCFSIRNKDKTHDGTRRVIVEPVFQLDNNASLH